MKKITAVLAALLLLFSLSVPAFADLGEAEFGDWHLLAGLSGYSFSEYDTDYETGEQIRHDGFLEPGVKVFVHSFNSYSGTYVVLLSDENYNPGYGRYSISEADLNKYFIDAKKTVGPENGQDLGRDVPCVVTADVGLILRQGPATTFPSYATVPFNTSLSYRYTYAYGGHNWGYTTYNGTAGWICTDYTKATEPVTEATTAQTETTLQAAETTGTAETAAAEETTARSTKNTGFFNNTTIIIICCCLFAVVLALVALVIILIVRRRKYE